MLKIGICGFGTVGQSFVDHIVSHSEKIRSNVSNDFDINVIADRSIDKKVYPSGIRVTKNPLDLPMDSDLDIIIELLGGIDLPYKIMVSHFNSYNSSITQINTSRSQLELPFNTTLGSHFNQE